MHGMGLGGKNMLKIPGLCQKHSKKCPEIARDTVGGDFGLKAPPAPVQRAAAWPPHAGRARAVIFARNHRQTLGNNGETHPVNPRKSPWKTLRKNLEKKWVHRRAAAIRAWNRRKTLGNTGTPTPKKKPIEKLRK
jgi:hypothetical protein